MNGSNSFFPKNNSVNNDRESEQSIDMLPLRPTIISAVNLLLCSLLVPFMLSGNEMLTYGLSLVVCLLSAVVVFNSSKHIFLSIFYTIALGLFIGSVTLPLLPALIFCPVVAIGSCAALVCSGKGFLNLAVPLLAIGSFAIPLIVFGDPILSLSALIIYLPVFALGFASRKGATASGTVIACTASVVAVLIGFLCFTVYDLYGTLSIDTINQAINDFAAQTVIYTEQGMELFTDIEVNEALHNEILSIVDGYINLGFGMIVAVCTVYSFIAFKIQNGMLAVHGITKYCDEQAGKITCSVITSFLFIIALILSFSLDPHGNTSIVSVIADNICLILTPILVLMAFEAIRTLPSRLGLIGLILSAAIVLLIIVGVFFTFPMIVPLSGAVYVIAIRVDAWAKEHYSKGENQ